jgi:hypothetical protein
MHKRERKRGQVTILIIVGVVLVLVFILFFFIFGKDIVSTQSPSKDPLIHIEQCVHHSVSPSIDSVLKYGGLIEPRFYIMRNDHEYNYLCFADDYYKKCTNYYPMLNRITQEEIRKDSIDRIKKCFDTLVQDYTSYGWDVEQKDLEYFVEIVPGNVRLKINKPLVVSKGDITERFENFNTKISSDLYDLISIARSVVSQEALYCYFENNGFMVMYPNYNMSKIDYFESKIYELENRNTKEVLKFAIRSCPYAPGFEGYERARI